MFLDNSERHPIARFFVQGGTSDNICKDETRLMVNKEVSATICFAKSFWKDGWWMHCVAEVKGARFSGGFVKKAISTACTYS
jgi:hypothetical protein